MSGGVRVDKALLRSRVSVRTKLGAGAGESHFAKVKILITDVINKLLTVHVAKKRCRRGA